MNKKDKLLTFASGKKYVVVDQCEYDNETYYFACEVINDETTDHFEIFTIKTVNEKQIIKKVKNDTLIKEVCKIIDKNNKV